MARATGTEPRKNPAPAWWQAGDAAWGCLMSHVMAVQEALLDGVERLLLRKRHAGHLW